MRIHTQKGREWKVLGDQRGLGEKGMISDRGNLNEMQRYSKWSLGDLCIVLCVFITFSLLAFLPFLSCPVSISHTHPLRSRSPFHSLIHTFMQLECQWGPRSLSTQQCNSLTAADLCQEEPQMPQQQFTCWRHYNHLNYRKQSRFVILSWADFSHCSPTPYVYIKWHIMSIFTSTMHAWWIFIFPIERCSVCTVWEGVFA